MSAGFGAVCICDVCMPIMLRTEPMGLVSVIAEPSIEDMIFRDGTRVELELLIPWMLVDNWPKE